MPDQPRKPLHPLIALGLIAFIASIAGAVALADWKVVVYGGCAFLALGVIGGLLQERHNDRS